METCDKCGYGVYATTKAVSDVGELFFCSHHAATYSLDLIAGGWVLISLNVKEGV